jgi:hypothetical protein
MSTQPLVSTGYLYARLESLRKQGKLSGRLLALGGLVASANSK